MSDERPPPPPGDATRPLSLIVGDEARRLLSEAQLHPDPNRVAAGWERRFIADGQRLQEAIDIYESLGFEVAADPIRPEEMGEDCEDCRLLGLSGFRTIYTRRPVGS